MNSPKSPSGLFALVFCLLAQTGLAASSGRVAFEHSITPIPAATTGAVPRQGRLVRTALTAEESAASVHFEVALRMRNLDELQARVTRGDVVSRAELEAKYLPLAADHARLISWLESQGFEVADADSSHLAVFATGSVSRVQDSLQVKFARVAAPDGEYTAAITAPSLPADVGAPVVGIHGLQPYLRHRPMVQTLAPASGRAGAQAATGYDAWQVFGAYGFPGTLDGTGQTIGVFGFAKPLTNDLTTFWASNGTQNLTTNVANVQVGSGPGSGANAPSKASTTEASLDAEWVSSLAPKAQVRIYEANETDAAAYDELYIKVIADLVNIPSLHVLSISSGEPEDELDPDYLVIQSQYILTLESAGVTVFAASGDGGSNPQVPTTGSFNTNPVLTYSSTAPLSVLSPADDINVTAVGGTTISISAALAVNSETAWSGSGGGLSAYIPRPSWQVGKVTAAGTMRAVPDVAAIADPNTGGFVYVNGTESIVGGTSLATPIWAAFCVLLNQSRGSTNPVGQLNAKIYPLLNTSSFRDITSGSNGAYSAGAGYDLVTGLGAPAFAALLTASLSPSSGAPVIAGQTVNPVGVVGQPVSIGIEAAGTATLTYQWQRQPAGGSAFANLSDNGTYSGSATPLLVIASPTLVMSGDQFQCVVTNGSGNITSKAQTLSVNSFGVTTLAGWPEVAAAADGTGWAARFDQPQGMVADGSGNLYVADNQNGAIRKITPAGVVTTFAGSLAEPGYNDATGTAAEFTNPIGLAIDGAGNLYVGDTSNYLIRKITPAGVVTSLAGTPFQHAEEDGPYKTGRFDNPLAITVDASGNLYVADGWGNSIREVSPAGVLSTIAGTSTSGTADGMGTAAAFNDPSGIALNLSSGVLYVSDTGNNTIRAITPQGLVSTFAGSNTVSGSADGTGTAARFNGPTGLKVDASGNLWVTDAGNGTIRMITPSGVVTTVIGSPNLRFNTDGLSTVARFFNPVDVVVVNATTLYVSDSVTNTIRRVALGGLPQITTSPTGVSTTSGQSAQFTVVATGTGTLTYQWQVLVSGAATWTNLTDAGAYSGSATATLTVANLDTSYDQDQFRCVVADPYGSANSNPATLAVTGAPVILTSSPTSPQVPTGDTITLSVTASGGTVTYQWAFNSVAISGATTSSYTISNFGTGSVGTYSVTVTNSYGSTSASFAASVSQARLINLSTRAFVGVGTANALTPGFVISGSGTKSMLIRGDGPALTAFSVPNALPTPALSLYDHNTNVIGANTGWGTTAGGTAALQAAFTQTGAFNFATGSADSAILQSLPAGTSYTAAITGVSNATGVALAELYDADVGASTGRLINISTRAQVTTANAIVAGFFIGGSGNEVVLIRGIGPGLAQFNVANVLASPVLTVYDANQNVIATTQTWNPALAATFAQVYAFGLQSGSNDTAVLLTLPAGNGYTAQISGLHGTGGVALVEVYEVP
jgi:sugar lactone lactonase YvrE